MDSKKKNIWVSLYRAVDSDRNTLGFLLRLMRDAKAAKRLCVKALQSMACAVPQARFAHNSYTRARI